MLFAHDVLQATGIEFRQTRGRTADQRVNEQHCDLIHLSAAKVLALTERLLYDHQELKRVDGKTVVRLIAESVRDGRILMSRLRPKLLADVRRYLRDESGEPQKPR